MKREELKLLLRELQNRRTQVYYVEKHLTAGKVMEERYRKMQYTIELLDAALKSLDEREFFVIYNHLVLHATWPETVSKMVQSFGIERMRSERTLKRIQNIALDKMLMFIDEVSGAQY